MTTTATPVCALQRQQCQDTCNIYDEPYYGSSMMECVVETLAGNRASFGIPITTTSSSNSCQLLGDVIVAAVHTSLQRDHHHTTNHHHHPGVLCCNSSSALLQSTAYLIHEGKVLDEDKLTALLLARRQQQQPHDSRHDDTVVYLKLHLRLLGGMDRQNRVGSKFGGGGVSTAQQSERERKDRLKRLALESIDLAKDPYLVRNHLGTLECKLCLTLHRDEANYLAHTQGKKHQAGLAKRAYLEKLQQQREQSSSSTTTPTAAAAAREQQQQQQKKVRIGRPAYQVFKSREAETNQRCLSFELSYPEIEAGWQPRHRFMSAFEQRVETPPDRRYQYLLFAADPYETVAFKIPNEAIDKGESRFVTHWDETHKKFILTLYFLEPTTTTTTDATAAATTTTTTTTVTT